MRLSKSAPDAPTASLPWGTGSVWHALFSCTTGMMNEGMGWPTNEMRGKGERVVSVCVVCVVVVVVVVVGGGGRSRTSD
jgi:hypothetical protein